MICTLQKCCRKKNDLGFLVQVNLPSLTMNSSAENIHNSTMLILKEISMHLSDYEKRFEFVTSVTRFLFAVDHFVWDYMYV